MLIMLKAVHGFGQGRLYRRGLFCKHRAMFRTVEMPLWLLALILAFAAVTFASHFLFPSVRWFFRRRMEKVVARLNERLAHKIEPFKLLHRHDMIQRLIYDPKVIEAVAEHARKSGLREDVAFQEARRYAREIVPSFSATAYFGIAIRLARWLSRGLYRVRLGHVDREAIRSIAPDATVVFVINHRSNMDYVLVTYLAADRSALAYAVGEWARVWPLSRLIKAMGAYFIRRRSRNMLYRRVLARYVQMATAGGVAQAVFPEGGLSLDGRVGEPKLGILSYMISAYEPGRSRDIVFVPVALNYDRVLEDRVLVAAGKSGKRKFRLRWRMAIRYVMQHFWQRLTGRFLRFGYAAVSFGAPVSLAEFVAREGTARAQDVAEELMQRIRSIIPVLPVPLVAACLLEAEGPMSREALHAEAERAAQRMQAAGAHVELMNGELAREVDLAVNHLLVRRVLSRTPRGLVVNEAERPLVEYYANSISHLLVGEKGA